MKEILAYSSSSKAGFESYINACLKDGWEIASTDCGFLNSESYDFCDSFHAILIKDSEGD